MSSTAGGGGGGGGGSGFGRGATAFFFGVVSALGFELPVAGFFAAGFAAGSAAPPESAAPKPALLVSSPAPSAGTPKPAVLRREARPERRAPRDKPASDVTARPAPKPRAACDVPYIIDAHGVKRFKPECF